MSTVVPAMRLSVFHVTEFEIVAYFIIFCLILLETGFRALFRLAESCAGKVLSFITADRVAVFASTIHVVRVTNLLCSPVILLIQNRSVSWEFCQHTAVLKVPYYIKFI